MADLPPSMAPVLDDALLDSVRARVSEQHWLSVYVPQDNSAYTVGLSTYDLPELVLRGVDDTVTAQVDRWAARLVAGELELGITITVNDLDLREHTFTTRPYDPAVHGGLLLARALYDTDLTAREIDVRSCPCPPCQAGLYARTA